MALIHRATLSPSKLELLSAWLPDRPWSGGGSTYEQLGAYRFDDPAGAVGAESFLLRCEDGTVLHVPVTYRAEPLVGASQHLVGTLDHSVLGRRHVYDGCADQVWVTAVTTAVTTAGTEAEEVVDVDGTLEPREPTARVSGSGSPDAPVGDPSLVLVQDGPHSTMVRTASADLVVVRTVGADTGDAAAGDLVLTGRWSGGGPAVLVTLLPGGLAAD
jgi:hypothetical protein